MFVLSTAKCNFTLPQTHLAARKGYTVTVVKTQNLHLYKQSKSAINKSTFCFKFSILSSQGLITCFKISVTKKFWNIHLKVPIYGQPRFEKIPKQLKMCMLPFLFTKTFKKAHRNILEHFYLHQIPALENYQLCPYELMISCVSQSKIPVSLSTWVSRADARPQLSAHGH